MKIVFKLWIATNWIAILKADPMSYIWYSFQSGAIIRSHLNVGPKRDKSNNVIDTKVAAWTLQILYVFKWLAYHVSRHHVLQLVKKSTWRIHKIPPNFRSKCEKNQLKPFKLTGKWLGELFKICTALNDLEIMKVDPVCYNGWKIQPGASIRSHLIFGPNVKNRVKPFKLTGKWLGELFKICTALNDLEIMKVDPVGYNCWKIQPGASIRSHLILGPNVKNRVKPLKLTGKLLGELFKALNDLEIMKIDPVGYNCWKI